MKFETWILLAILALVVFVVGWWVKHHFSESARRERRRRRSNAPIATKHNHRPSIRFNANLKKKRKKR